MRTLLILIALFSAVPVWAHDGDDGRPPVNVPPVQTGGRHHGHTNLTIPVLVIVGGVVCWFRCVREEPAAIPAATNTPDQPIGVRIHE